MKIAKRLSFGLLIIMLLVLAAATITEKVAGTAVAQKFFYHSPLFVGLWTLIAVSGTCYIVTKHLYKRLSVFLLHISFLLILAGAGSTWIWGTRGKVQIPVGAVQSAFTDADGRQVRMPFGIRLTDFHVEFYPGTQAPMDFVSEISLIDDEYGPTQGVVSMNNIMTHRGYRIYQMGYDPSMGGTVLQISHDPWGIGLTYCGYLLLFGSSLWVLIDRRSRFRRLLSGNASRVVAAVLFALGAFSATASATELPPSLPSAVAADFGDLYILHNQRICPFSTFARDITLKITGKASFRGLSAEQVVTGCMFYYDEWADVPMIKIKSAKVRQALNLQGKFASLNDFYSPQNEYRLRELVSQVLAGNDVEDRRGIQEANEKYELMRMLVNGSSVKILPVSVHDTLQWHSQSSSLDLPASLPPEKWAFLRNALNYLNELVVKKDWRSASAFITALRRYQVKECGTALPSQARFKAEKIYNHLNFSRFLFMLLASLGMILFVVQCRLFASGKALRRPAVVAVNVVLLVALLYLTLVIALRWIVSGNVPLSNGFETMQFMSWASLLLTLLMQRRTPAILSFGTLVAGLTLMVSTFGESNPQITPLMPVLQSPLLSIHVVVIMLAYSLLAFLMLGGIMAIALRHHPEQVRRLHRTSLLMLYPAVFLLAAGIFIGAVWANISWGNYWGWDPKETWALITFIIYALQLHSESLPAFRRPIFFHGYMALAFLSVLITYFGVNFVLGGMHSYA